MKCIKLIIGLVIGMTVGMIVGMIEGEKKKSGKNMLVRMINGVGDFVEKVSEALGM